MADYAEINNFPPELSSGGDKYFHLRNYSEYSEYTREGANKFLI